jgi:hypothetical protein
MNIMEQERKNAHNQGKKSYGPGEDASVSLRQELPTAHTKQQVKEVHEAIRKQRQEASNS